MDEAAWSRKPNVSSSPLLSSFSQLDTTCVLVSAAHTQCLLCIGTCSPSSKPPCIKCPDATACKLPYWKPCHCCFVSPKARQCNWSSDMTHCKVRHFLSCGLPPRQDSYPTSVATARATRHSQQSSLRSPATEGRPRGVPHSHTLQTIKVGRRGKQNATTTHMTNSRKQRTSMSQTDMSASLEPFAILAPSSTTVSAMTTISRRG